MHKQSFPVVMGTVALSIALSACASVTPAPQQSPAATTIAVPNVVGLSAGEALTTLSEIGVTPQSECEPGSETVTHTTPESRTIVPKTSAITIYCT
jgi:hypothetical protein